MPGRPGGPIRGYGIGMRRGTAAPAGRAAVRRRWRAASLPQPRRSLGARRSALGARRSALGARRSALGARRSALGARRSALGARRSALGARRSALGARRSALGARRSALGARRSALGARRSALGARRSALGARRSALLIRQTASNHCAQCDPIVEPPLAPVRSDDALPLAKFRAGARVARARWPAHESLHCGHCGGIRTGDARACQDCVLQPIGYKILLSQ